CYYSCLSFNVPSRTMISPLSLHDALPICRFAAQKTERSDCALAPVLPPNSVTKTRMQPISNVFDKFPRVVRDVAMACGKQVQIRSEEHTSELQSRVDIVCRLLLAKKKGAQ